jgi:peptide/nickel transport system substrate-binding protein
MNWTTGGPRRAPARRWIAVPAAAVVAALGLTACGGGGGGSAGGATGAGGGTKAIPTTAHNSTPLTFVTDGVPDSLDPAMAYNTVLSFQIAAEAYSGMLGYARTGDAQKAPLIPVLAEAMPQPTDGGRVYTLTLRQGATYSNGQPVKASDFKCGVQRVFAMGSPGTTILGSLDGASKGAKDPSGLGVSADDTARTVTFKLAHPDGSFLYALATQFTVPIPCGTPSKDQSSSPIPGTGPYVISSYTPQRKIVLKPNPHFAALPQYPAAANGGVTWDLNVPPTQATRMLQDNQADWAMSTVAGTSTGYLTGDSLTQFQAENESQFHLDGQYYTKLVAMNATIPPFDNQKVRQAVNYAVDRSAIMKLFGGNAAPACEFLPPGVDGYANYCPYGTTPNLAKAKSLVQQSGDAGMSVVVNTSTDQPFPLLGAYLQSVLKSIGLKASVKSLGDTPYFALVGTTKNKWQMGEWDWSSSAPDASAWFGPLVNGENLTPTGNLVLSRLNDPKLNKAIDAANTLSGSARTAALQAIEKQVSDLALFVPYEYPRAVNVVSSRVTGFVVQPAALGVLWQTMAAK